MSYPSPASQIVYHQAVPRPGNGMAITAMVLGIVSVVFGVWMVIPLVGLFFAAISVVPAVLAVVFGVIGGRQAARVQVGRAAATAGLVLGAVTLAIGVITTSAWIAIMAAAASSHSA